MPQPRAFSFAPPIPVTDHSSDGMGLNDEKKFLWSHVCFVAPESAKKRVCFFLSQCWLCHRSYFLENHVFYSSSSLNGPENERNDSWLLVACSQNPFEVYGMILFLGLQGILHVLNAFDSDWLKPSDSLSYRILQRSLHITIFLTNGRVSVFSRETLAHTDLKIRKLFGSVTRACVTICMPFIGCCLSFNLSPWSTEWPN